MTKSVRSILDEHWELLAAAPTQGVRVSELPVETSLGRVAAAVDQSGFRHLLVPIEAQQQVRKGVTGPVLQLSKRPLEGDNSYAVYADLGCLRPEFDDVFTTLCIDILIATEQVSEQPIKGLYRVLDHWRSLFQNVGGKLGPDQITGLFAELLVLRRMLKMQPSAHQLWRGPAGHPHDFASAGTALEVKATAGIHMDGRVRIHGLAQLDEPLGGNLQLAWFRLAPDADGLALQTLIDEVLQLADDSHSLLQALVLAGYRAQDVEQYRSVSFDIAEERWFRVEPGFPRLTARMLESATVPVEVDDVHYTIDLNKAVAMTASSLEIGHHLAALTGVQA